MQALSHTRLDIYSKKRNNRITLDSDFLVASLDSFFDEPPSSNLLDFCKKIASHYHTQNHWSFKL